MPRFAQHVLVKARPGKREVLAAKFVEALSFLADNDACELTLVSTSPDDPDAVLLTEIWASEADHAAVVRSEAVAAWAADMPELTAATPVVQRLEPVAWMAAPRG